MFGTHAQEVLGRTLKSLWPAACRDDHERAVAEFFRSGDSHQVRQHPNSPVCARTAASSPRVSLSTWRTDEGRFLTAIMRDISERGGSKEDLRQKDSSLSRRTGWRFWVCWCPCCAATSATRRRDLEELRQSGAGMRGPFAACRFAPGSRTLKRHWPACPTTRCGSSCP